MTLTEITDNKVGGQTVTLTDWRTSLKANINDLIGLRSRNLLTNGGFEVWQRGAGPIANQPTSVPTYTADRWALTSPGGGSMSATQETTTVDVASLAALKVVKASTLADTISQKLEDYAQLRGKTIAFSVRVNQSVASALVPFIADSVGTTNGATLATTGGYVTLTVTRTIAAGATSVTVGFGVAVVGTYYLDNAMLVMGPTAADYVPLHPQEELARCQRYYEVHGGVNPSVAYNGYNAAGQSSGQYIPFAVPKGGTPTVTKFGTWGVNNCGQPGVSGVWSGGYTLSATTTALGAMGYAANSTDDTIVAEFNP